MNSTASTKPKRSSFRASSRDSKLLTVAIHEAAHAMLAISQERVVDEIRVKMVRGCCVGRATYALRLAPSDFLEPPHPYSVDIARIDAMSDSFELLAGPIAELRWRQTSVEELQFIGEQYRDQFNRSCVGPSDASGCNVAADLLRTERTLSWAFGCEAAAALLEAWKGALSLVLTYWLVIEELARALAEHRHLLAGQIMDVVGPHIMRTVH